MKSRIPLLVFTIIFVGMLFGCRHDSSVPVAEATVAPTNTATPVPQPRDTPTNIPSPQPTETLVPTDTPSPTFTPSPTPLPLLTVLILDAADESPLAGVVQIADAEGFYAEQTAVADGQSVFAGVTDGAVYTVTVKTDGYLDAVLTHEFAADEEALTILLEAGVFVTVNTADGRLRSGPGTVYDVIGSVAEGDSFQVMGRNEAGDWLLVLTEAGDDVWLAADLADEVDVRGVAVTAAPSTPTPAPTKVVVAPPPPSAPALPAGNLIINGSFEAGETGWDPSGWRLFYGVVDHPQFVHSGTQAAFGIMRPNAVYSSALFQHVHNVTPGQTYQAGVWVEIWSSTGEDRTRSENPGDYSAQLCIGPQNETAINPETTVCTGFVRPLDTWQYLTVSAVAETDIIAVILHSAPLGPNLPTHNEAIWDDVSLTASFVAATPTPAPAPAGPPTRPGAIPFNAVALRDSMTSVEWTLNQMGGLLDRLYNGSWETCEEYEGYYGQLMGSSIYHSLPDEWNGVYNEYIFAVENTIGYNNGVYSLCTDGGGSLSAQAYGEARSSIADSLNRLIPAVQAANAMAGE